MTTEEEIYKLLDESTERAGEAILPTTVLCVMVEEMRQKIAAENARLKEELAEAKKLAAEYDRQVTLNRNNWMIDSEEKDRKIGTLTREKTELLSALFSLPNPEL